MTAITSKQRYDKIRELAGLRTTGKTYFSVEEAVQILNCIDCNPNDTNTPLLSQHFPGWIAQGATSLQPTVVNQLNMINVLQKERDVLIKYSKHMESKKRNVTLPLVIQQLGELSDSLKAAHIEMCDCGTAVVTLEFL